MPLKAVLARWYERNKRPLPWRRNRNPYRIWISEIILQQTRVDQGLPYYEAFIARFPDLDRLAHADEESVLKVWQGLGYYSRARNMLAAARDLVENHGGRFPRSRDELQSLRGIGPYTAAAIASMAFNEPVPVVDGNVERVLARVFGIAASPDTVAGKRIFLKKADDVLDRDQPGRHNQALMEFGALQCVPHNPDCSRCPLKTRCRAYGLGQVGRYPVKAAKKAERQRFLAYFFIRWNNHILLRRRLADDIWKNLYDLPLVEFGKPTAAAAAHLAQAGVRTGTRSHRLEKIHSCRHQLTHQRLHVEFYALDVRRKPRLTNSNLLPVRIDQLGTYPVPRLIERYFRSQQIL